MATASSPKQNNLPLTRWWSQWWPYLLVLVILLLFPFIMFLRWPVMKLLAEHYGIHRSFTSAQEIILSGLVGAGSGSLALLAFKLFG